MWVLFLIVATGNAVTSTTAYFGDQAACRAALKEMAPQLSTLLTPTLEVLDLPTRARNALEIEGIRTIPQLRRLTDLELLRMPNMGRKSVAAIKVALARRGRRLMTDPIFTIIEAHSAASVAYSAATDVSCTLLPGPEFEAADAISAERHEALRARAYELIATEPTTPAGITAAARYVAGLQEWQMPPPYDPDGIDTSLCYRDFLGTLANAVERLSNAAETIGP